ncbi:MAG: DNA primase, partial [Campylobacteraceae bacterium]|nr:DNA primase [Campylobacteraceae bacterium]
MIDNESIETLKQRVDIIDVVGSYLELKKAGANYKAICPFHSDTTPSLHVSPSKQIYHCFACGAGGDSIKFVMEYEKLTYPESIEKIASMYNFTLTYKEGEFGEKKQDRKILENLNLFFRKCLDQNDTAKKYLLDRGIGESSITKFEIGFAPESRIIINFLKKNAYTTKECIELGATGINENGNEYSRFIERITFPIQSPNGKVVGFGGRTISNHPAKYINSPQTKLFSKSRLLYGYNFAKEKIAKEGRIIVCEGYLDVIMLHQAGFNEAVATLGTALTSEHIPLLSRANPKVILSYDGDSAGIEAASKASKLLSQHGIDGGVVLFSDNMDPADMVQKGLINKLNELYNKPKNFIEFTLEQNIKKYDLKYPMEKQKALDESLDFLKTLPATLAQNYVGIVASLLNMKEGLIRLNNKQKIRKPLPNNSFEDMLELSVIKTLLINPNFIDIVLDIVDVSMFKTHSSELENLLNNKRDTPELRRLLLWDDIKVFNEDELINALIPFLINFYKEKINEVRSS